MAALRLVAEKKLIVLIVKQFVAAEFIESACSVTVLQIILLQTFGLELTEFT